MFVICFEKERYRNNLSSKTCFINHNEIMTETHAAPNASMTTTTIEDLYKAFGELADAKENAGKV